MNRVGALLLWGSMGLSAPAWAQDGASDSTLVFSLQGTVYDKATLVPLQGAKVNVVGTDGSSFSALSDANGAFMFAASDSGRYIKGNSAYSIQIEIGPYTTLKDQISTVDLKESTTFVKEYFLQPGCTGGGNRWSPIVHFSHASATISATAESVLKEALTIMRDNPSVVLEIIGNTDHQEVDSLGLKRSAAVRNWLIAAGIHAGRLVHTSRGNEEAVVTLEQIRRMATREEREAAHAKNRHAYFRVIRTDWKE